MLCSRPDDTRLKEEWWWRRRAGPLIRRSFVILIISRKPVFDVAKSETARLSEQQSKTYRELK